MSTGSAMTPVTVASVGHRPMVNRRTTPERRSASTMVDRRDRINAKFFGRRNGKLYQLVRLSLQAESRLADVATRSSLFDRVEEPIPARSQCGVRGAKW